MPLPVALEEAIQCQAFWREYVVEREAKRWNYLVRYEWPALGTRCRVEIPVGGGYQLLFDQGRDLGRTYLRLRRPGVKKEYFLALDSLEFPRKSG
jgi:hypothetical protein